MGKVHGHGGSTSQEWHRLRAATLVPDPDPHLRPREVEPGYFRASVQWARRGLGLDQNRRIFTSLVAKPELGSHSVPLSLALSQWTLWGTCEILGVLIPPRASGEEPGMPGSPAGLKAPCSLRGGETFGGSWQRQDPQPRPERV